MLGPADLWAELHLQSERRLAPFGRSGTPSQLVALADGAVAPSPWGTLNAVGPGMAASIMTSLNVASAQASPPLTDRVAFVGDRSHTLSGWLASGHLSDTVTTVDGTSFSTALAGRAAAVARIAGP